MSKIENVINIQRNLPKDRELARGEHTLDNEESSSVPPGFEGSRWTYVLLTVLGKAVITI